MNHICSGTSLRREFKMQDIRPHQHQDVFASLIATDHRKPAAKINWFEMTNQIANRATTNISL